MIKSILVLLILISQLESTAQLKKPSYAMFIDRPIAIKNEDDKSKNEHIEYVTKRDNLIEVELPFIDDNGQRVIIVIDKSDDNSTTISLPNQSDVEITQREGETSINIPGQGEIIIISDDPQDGFDIKITPEQISNSDNIDCTINSKNSGSCEFTNFNAVIGNKVLFSDKLSASYEKQKDLQIIDATASNLIIQDEDNKTTIENEITSFGQTHLSLSFDDNSGAIIPHPSSQSLKESEKVSLSFSSQNFVHEVSDANGSNYKPQIKVKDEKGINGHISFDKNRTSALIQTQAGVEYQSNPHSNNEGTSIESNAPLTLKFDSILETTNNTPSTVMEVYMPRTINNESDKEVLSHLTIIEHEKSGQLRKTKSSGELALRIESKKGIDLRNGDKLDIDKGPLELSLISDHITHEEYNRSGELIKSVSLDGTKVQLETQPDSSGTKINASANKLSIKNKDTQIKVDDDIRIFFQADNNKDHLEVSANRASYTNKQISASTTGDLKFVQYNNKASRNDDINRYRSLTGNTAKIEDIDNEREIELKGPYRIEQISLHNGDQHNKISATDASLSSSQYHIDFDNSVDLVYDKSTDPNNKSTTNENLRFISDKVDITDKKRESSLSLADTQTSIKRQNTGNNAKKEVLSIESKTNKVKYQNSDTALSANDIIASVQTKENYMYAQLAATDITYSDKTKSAPKGVIVKDIELAFLVDETNQDSELKTMLMNASKLQVKDLNYSVDIALADSNGKESDEKFTIIYHQEDSFKTYSIFNENGKKIELNLMDKNSHQYKLLFESVQYFEDKEFKTVMANNLSSSIKKVNGDHQSLTQFQVSKFYGQKSLNGDQIHLSLTDGNIAHTLKKQEAREIVSSEFNHLLYSKDSDKEIMIADLNTASYSNKGKQPKAIELEGAKLYLSRQKGETPLTSADIEANSLALEDINYSVDIRIKDGELKDKKFKIIFLEKGPIKYTKIYAKDDDQLVQLSAEELSKNKYDILFSALEYYEDDKTKELIVKNLNGSFTPLANDKLDTLGLDIDSLYIRQGPIKNDDLQDKDDLVVQAKNAHIDLKSRDNNGYFTLKTFQYKKEDAIEVGLIDLTHLDVARLSDDQKNIQSIQIDNAQILFTKDNSETSAQAQIEKLEITDANYKISITTDDIADEGQNKKSQYDILIYENENEKYVRLIKKEDGKRIEINIDELDKSRFKALLDEIEYYKSNEFEIALAKNIKGELIEVDGNASSVHLFDFETIQATNNTQTNEKSIYAHNGTVNSTIDTKNKFSLNGVMNSGYSENSDFKYANINFEKAEVVTDIGDQNQSELRIYGGQLVFTQDIKDGLKQGQADISAIEFKNSDYIVDIGIRNSKNKNSNNKDKYKDEERFRISFYEMGNQKYYKVYKLDPNGDPIEVIINDDNKKEYEFLVDSVEYIENENVKSFMAQNFQGNFKDIKGLDKLEQASYTLKSDTVYAHQDESTQLAALTNLDLSRQQDNTNLKLDSAQLNYQRNKFNEGNYIQTESLISLDGLVEYIETGESQGNIDKLKIKAEYGKLVANRLKQSDGKEITIIKGEDISFSAIDITNDVDLSGKIGSLDVFDSDVIQTIDIKDLENFQYKDLESQASLSASAKRIYRVVEKDKNGKIKSQYLLVNNALLDYQDPKNSINANIKIGVLELLQDKLHKQNIVLKADVSGRIVLDKSVKPELNFTLKGEKMLFNTENEASADGAIKSGSISIDTLNGGHIEEIKLSAGPSFLKDFISIKAKGSKNAKAIRFSFLQDKNKGTYYLRSEFRDGDKVKLKLFPFTLESKKQGGDAVAEIKLTPKGQSYKNHLEIIASVADMQEVTNWLNVNEDTIALRANVTDQTGLEVFYSKEDLWNNPFDLDDPYQVRKAASVGLSLVRKKKSGAENSYGVMLSGDSEISYETNGNGVLKIAGIDMDQNGSIPATMNLFFRRKNMNSSHMVNLGYSTTGHIVDFDYLDEDAQFYENGLRGKGGASLSYAYSTKPSKDSKLSFGIGAYENGDALAANICYQTKFDLSFIGKQASSISPIMKKVIEKNKKEQQRKLASTNQYKLDNIEYQFRYLNSLIPGLKVAYKINDQMSLIHSSHFLDNRNNFERLYSLSNEELKAYTELKEIVGGVDEIMTFDRFDSLKAYTEVLNIEQEMAESFQMQQKELARIYEQIQLFNKEDVKKRCQELTKRFKAISDKEAPKCLEI